MRRDRAPRRCRVVVIRIHTDDGIGLVAKPFDQDTGGRPKSEIGCEACQFQAIFEYYSREKQWHLHPFCTTHSAGAFHCDWRCTTARRPAPPTRSPRCASDPSAVWPGSYRARANSASCAVTCQVMSTSKATSSRCSKLARRLISVSARFDFRRHSSSSNKPVSVSSDLRLRHRRKRIFAEGSTHEPETKMQFHITTTCRTTSTVSCLDQRWCIHVQYGHQTTTHLNKRSLRNLILCAGSSTSPPVCGFLMSVAVGVRW